MDRPRKIRLTARLVPAAVAALALCLAFGAGSAAAFTAPPTLLAPSASSAHGSPLSVEYELPEAGSSGTIKFVPASGPTVTVTLSSPALAAGKHHFFLSLFALASETANVTEASASSLSDAEYTVVLGYSNLAKEVAATASALKVTIKTATGAPSLSEPTAGEAFRTAFKVAYTLPEAALPGSVTLTLTGSHTEARKLTLSGTSAGSHTATIVPSDPALGTGVVSGPSERLPADTYAIALSYQDSLGNPAASTLVANIGVGYPLCKAGSYGVDGEEPCTEAPKGSFVANEGASSASECIAGFYTPGPGLSMCVPASPGNYVPAAGAKEELECEQGSYSDETQLTSCKAATPGHYAPRGSVLAAACPAGTHNPHTNAPSAEYCETDAPGSFSGEGAAEATLCEAGRYAPASGSETCLLADPGSYVEGKGASSETACPAGTYAGVTGSVACTETPAGTYAAGGAVEPTPCPAGTNSGKGASACAAPAEVSGGSHGSQSGSGAPPVKTPAPTVLAPVGVKIAAGRHAKSLRRTRLQTIVITCSVAANVKVRVSASVTAGMKHATINGTATAVNCLAGKATQVAVRFKVGTAAGKVLRAHGARVKLAVRVYLTGASAGLLAGSGSVAGRP